MTEAKEIILILSGKGGVGKSSVTAQLALSLVAQGKRVGVLDIDLTGPSLPEMFGLSGKKIHQSNQGWVPVYVGDDQKCGVVSVGFLLSSKEDPVIWRGPKKNAMIKQFVQDVSWGPLDYLLIDTPPGTSDEHISIMGYLKEFSAKTSAILVTTPQAVSLQDVKREINFCKKVGLKINGMIENMSGFVCPHCAECTDLFSSGGGESLAKDFGIRFMGRVPIDPSLTTLIEKEDFPTAFPQSQSFTIFSKMTENL